MTKFAEFFQDGEGRLSATRLGFLLWVVGVLVVWISNSLSHGALQAVPESVTAILGVLMTGKVVQSFGENSANPTSSTTTQSTTSITGTASQQTATQKTQ